MRIGRKAMRIGRKAMRIGRKWLVVEHESSHGMAVLSWLHEAGRCYRRAAAARAVVRAASWWLVVVAGCVGSSWALSRAGLLTSAALLANARVSTAALGLAVPLCLLAWVATYLLNRPSPLRIARSADASLALEDRLSSAFECLHGRGTLLSPMLLEDAASRLEGMEPSRIGTRVTTSERRFLSVAVALALVVSALTIALPATVANGADPTARQEGERLGSLVRRLQGSLAAQDDASRSTRSFLSRAEAIARGMAQGTLGAEDAASGLAGLLEELAPDRADPGDEAVQGPLGVGASPGGRGDAGSQTSVLGYDARASELRSLVEDLSAAVRREMSPDEASGFARRLRDLARTAGGGTKAAEAAERAADALESGAREGERKEAVKEVISAAVNEFIETAQESAGVPTQPGSPEALKQLRDAVERAKRALEDHAQDTPSMPPIPIPRPGDGGTVPDRAPGGEIRPSGDAPGEPNDAGSGDKSDESPGAIAPGTEPGARQPGPPAPRLDSSAGMLYPAGGRYGEGEMSVTTVLRRGSLEAAGRPDTGDGASGPPGVEVEESVVAQDMVPQDYRIVVERYFD